MIIHFALSVCQHSFVSFANQNIYQERSKKDWTMCDPVGNNQVTLTFEETEDMVRSVILNLFHNEALNVFHNEDIQYLKNEFVTSTYIKYCLIQKSKDLCEADIQLSVRSF
jgi:hypothetical protein